MNIFKTVMAAVIVGLVLAGCWLGMYTLILGLFWIMENLSIVWTIAIFMFIAGVAFYITGVADV